MFEHLSLLILAGVHFVLHDCGSGGEQRLAAPEIAFHQQFYKLFA